MRVYSLGSRVQGLGIRVQVVGFKENLYGRPPLEGGGVAAGDGHGCEGRCVEEESSCRDFQPTRWGERIVIQRMTSDRKLKASKEESSCRDLQPAPSIHTNTRHLLPLVIHGGYACEGRCVEQESSCRDLQPARCVPGTWGSDFRVQVLEFRV